MLLAGEHASHSGYWRGWHQSWPTLESRMGQGQEPPRDSPASGSDRDLPEMGLVRCSRQVHVGRAPS
jgi:hypothetical protein